MSVLKARKEVFEFSLEDIKKLISADLNVPEDKIQVEYTMVDMADDRFERYSRYEVNGIKVTVDKT